MDTLMQTAVSLKLVRELLWTAFLGHYVKDKYYSGTEICWEAGYKAN